jgi:hypothetical protein
VTTSVHNWWSRSHPMLSLTVWGVTTMTTCIEKVFMAIVFLEGLCCWEVVSLVTLVG